MDLTNKNTIKSLLQKHNLWAKKGFGQNFLTDKEALDSLVDSAGIRSNETILEVGPGLGVLTTELCKKAGKVIAVEKDKEILEVLKETTAEFRNLEIANEDILEYQVKEKNYKVAASLPFYISSPIFRKFLGLTNKPRLMSLIVQKEVAEKATAREGEMNVLAVSIQFYGKAEIIMIIPKTSFFPVPKVDAAILMITPYEKPLFDVNEKLFFRIVKAGFGEKRKKLINSLAGGLQLEKGKVAKILADLSIDTNIRAEDLNLKMWQELYQNLQEVL
ncbi:MAG: 16S rRNA (adenine(1518)-N(6)/adenine(1519)-N(6))-dimethyltransferase RsmA [Patescibacteria group bacterium]|nr:16S rRNA (adenine(1518)-N(6)/adenine(1519)-N(6))-dimethyltransferase RsmA [Patescibacteria group bacterium]MCL5094263.1 16S rRNA (adenine(1518)-N(6)/adenine(1519)-N(6))-dimethyltransferase RsmA [Patescibacteria group bacterium]